MSDDSPTMLDILVATIFGRIDETGPALMRTLEVDDESGGVNPYAAVLKEAAARRMKLDVAVESFMLIVYRVYLCPVVSVSA